MAAAGHALEQALAYYRAPALLAMAKQRPLPDDVIELLRLAAGDAAQASTSAEASGESPQRVAEAAVFFVQQVMFSAEADPHRVLGVNPDAPAARIREHYRWLIRWLHPDRNADEWDSVYTDRVTRAWQHLRRSGALAGEGDPESELPERRAHPRPEIPAVAPTVLAATRRAHVSREQPAAPMLSARTARRLPVFVLGGLGLAAVSLVALIWYAQQNPIRPRLAAPPPVGGTSVPIPPVTADNPADRAMAASADSQPPEPVGIEIPPTEIPADADGSALLSVAAPAADAPAPAAVGGNSFPIAPPTPTIPTPRPPNPAQTTAQITTPAPPVGGTAVGGTSVPIAPPTAAPVGNEFPPTAASIPATPQSATIEQAAAHAVLGRFTDAYAAGDLSALMRLFTRDAINNRGGRDAIAYDYQSLFSQTRERRLALQPNGWITRDDGAVVLAGYEAWVKEGRLRPGTTSRGSIRFTLRREDGTLKISQVIHD